MSNFSNKKYFLLFACVLSIAGFNIFFRLGSTKAHSWDESTYGVDAYEMIQNNEYIITTFGEDTDDHHSLKPPLGLWLIIAGYKLFGYNLFALRFASAISGFGCIVIIMLILYRKNLKMEALISGLVLATTYSFLCHHSARSGEYDVLLTFFICISVLSIETVKNNSLKSATVGLMISLSFLLKSFAAIYLILIVILYIFISKRYKEFKINHLILLILFSLAPILAWGYLRYIKDGYSFLQKMVQLDLLERTTRAVHGHSGGYSYYFIKMMEKNWYWILTFLSTLFLIRKKINSGVIKKHVLYVIWFLVPITVATFIKTKLSWYIVPSYPALAIITALSIGIYLKDKNIQKKNKKILVAVILLITLGAEVRITSKILSRQPTNFHKALKQIPSQLYEGCNIYSNYWSQSNIFIAKVVNGFNYAFCDNFKEGFLPKAIHNDVFMGKEKDINVKNKDELTVIAAYKDWLVIKKRDNPR
ncbi:MAG: glycosyltransferase family 39 protein [Candidatus Aureabacteria bacterium]|nr:glycosyltransferase family 39 protein [Candidatus Auribacterota bacterium]